MNEENQCKNCSYFFGRERIHCAVHPYGKASEYCKDWQQKNLSLQKEELMNTNREAKPFSYTEFASHLLAIGTTLFVGYQLYQNIPPAIHASKDYDRYKTECEIFLERASKAGTTKIASVELTKGISWLESKSLTQSFEYRDLKSNLDYLKKQPENVAMPVTIKDSINYNLEDIREKQRKLRDEGRPGLGSVTDLVIYIFTSILICLLTLVVIAAWQETFEL
ncbi:hypothetical protein [Chlorogloea sp. CCALA 695]|uniref:hypothetical protein n=1 Tax=Chlorogloea sp. CCALA 695 TaxID=2107693 RepID=UPI000D04BA73|nr:hypothetical protein [Chlorogloea sp. CCALA 695]PSB26103.1 hypothetical protein C7B70_24310 [Chlorogloea sp. CCALA 695]